ncbi:MAG: hydroxymethylglutaryl-CoA lyase [Pseudomonadota bacterium]
MNSPFKEAAPGPAAVEIMEVSPRDGLQNEARLVSTDDKLRLIEQAIDSGIKRIEVTSFVHPKRVPQMADADELCAQLPQRGDLTYAGLVLNERGYERLLATGRLNEVGLVIPASDTFGERNQGQSVDDGLAMACEVLADAKQRGIAAQVTIAVAFGCPFEGEVPVERILAMAERLAAAGPVHLGLADTVGVGGPSDVLERFGGLRQSLGDALPLRAHFHDTRNTGIANAFAALHCGVHILDASIGGIGGCPFAPNATGNIATEDLLYMLNRAHVEHGVDLESTRATAAWLETVLDKAVPSMLLKAGDFPGEIYNSASA